MSGGSWDYLCYEDAVELLGRMDDLVAMKDRLFAEGFYKAYATVVSLLMQLRRAKEDFNAIDKVLDGGLSGVFKAVEWCDSGDITCDSMKESIENYEMSIKGECNDTVSKN